MMEPSLALQGAFFTKLTADGDVTALIAQRVYDRVPKTPEFPYIIIGADQTIADPAECLPGSVQIFSEVHVWSRSAGRVGAKKIAGAVVRALHNAVIDLTAQGYTLVVLQHDNTRHLEDPDGLTTHSVVLFHAHLDEV